MKSIKLFLGTLFLITVFTVACSSDNGDDIVPEDPGNNCNTEDVTYSGTVLSIINSSCAVSGCHVDGGSGNGNFESYDGVKAKVDNGSFQDRVLDQKNMPPNGSLSDCQLEQLQAWINDGALNN